jgi:hypothetical protein
VGTAKAFGGSLHDQIEHTIGVGVQLGIPNPQNRPALAGQKGIAPNIALAIDMLTAVQLDYEFGLTAGEIGDVGTDRQLAGEPRPKPRNQMP